MSRRKGERISARNGRDFPFIVRLPAPEGQHSQRLLDQISIWHSERGLIERRGRAARVNDCSYKSWRFSDKQSSLDFYGEFGPVPRNVLGIKPAPIRSLTPPYRSS